MKKIASRLLAFGLLSAAALACSSESSGDRPVTDETLEAIADSYCTRIGECYGEFFVKTYLGDVATCKSRLAIEIKASTKGPGFVVKDSEAHACRTAVDAAPCSAIQSSGIAECDFRGTLADGAACASDSQCSSGACYVEHKTACGKCAARVAEGADCTRAQCEPGLVCNAAKRCVLLPTEGTACDGLTPCATSLSCIGGVCTKELALGAPCEAGAGKVPCDSSAGLFCKPPSMTETSGTCSAATLVSAGQACGFTVQPAVDFATCQASECVGASGTTKGTCQAYLADGAPCDAAKHPSCQFPSKCRDGKCVMLDPTVCK